MWGNGGSDRLLGDIQPCVEPAGLAGVTLDGGAGDDFVTGLMGWDNELAGAFSLRMTGGDGNDFLASDIQPCVRPGGSVDVVLDGGAGDDFLVAQLTSQAEPPVPGDYHFRVLGGAGNDRLTFVATGPLRGADLFLDGGSGFDLAVVTANVLVRNVERVAVIPG